MQTKTRSNSRVRQSETTCTHRNPTRPQTSQRLLLPPRALGAAARDRGWAAGTRTAPQRVPDPTQPHAPDFLTPHRSGPALRIPLLLTAPHHPRLPAAPRSPASPGRPPPGPGRQRGSGTGAAAAALSAVRSRPQPAPARRPSPACPPVRPGLLSPPAPAPSAQAPARPLHGDMAGAAHHHRVGRILEELLLQRPFLVLLLFVDLVEVRHGRAREGEVEAGSRGGGPGGWAGGGGRPRSRGRSGRRQARGEAAAARRRLRARKRPSPSAGGGGERRGRNNNNNIRPAGRPAPRRTGSADGRRGRALRRWVTRGVTASWVWVRVSACQRLSLLCALVWGVRRSSGAGWVPVVS